MKLKQADLSRFWALVEKTDGCWPWRGFVNDQGSGELYDEIRIPNAHLWPPGKKLEIAIRPRD